MQHRDLWRLDIYLALTAAAVVVALASVRSRRAFSLMVGAALAAGFALAGSQASLRLAETLSGEL